MSAFGIRDSEFGVSAGTAEAGDDAVSPQLCLETPAKRDDCAADAVSNGRA
jgi:hypothetical protein